MERNHMLDMFNFYNAKLNPRASILMFGAHAVVVNYRLVIWEQTFNSKVLITA